MTTTDKQFIEASAELARELELTPQEAAAGAVRYRELKDIRAHVLGTGEVATVTEYDKESEFLNARLKQYILDHGGEPITVEGQPDLSVTTPQSEDVDAPALLEHEPDIFYALVAARVVKVDVKLARKVLDPDQASRLNAMAHALGGTPRLAFAREVRR